MFHAATVVTLTLCSLSARVHYCNMTPRNRIKILFLLLLVFPCEHAYVSASIQSGDSSFEPNVDGLIGEREYYEAELHYIDLLSSSRPLFLNARAPIDIFLP